MKKIFESRKNDFSNAKVFNSSLKKKKSLEKYINPGHLDGSVVGASDLGTGHDLVVREFEPPASGCLLTARSLEPALESVTPPLSVPSLAHALSLSQKINKH